MITERKGKIINVLNKSSVLPKKIISIIYYKTIFLFWNIHKVNNDIFEQEHLRLLTITEYYHIYIYNAILILFPNFNTMGDYMYIQSVTLIVFYIKTVLLFIKILY